MNERNQQHEEGFFLCVAIKDRRILKGKVSPVQREHAYMRHFPFLTAHHVDLRSISES